MVRLITLLVIVVSKLNSQEVILNNEIYQKTEIKRYKTPISGVVITPTAYKTYGFNEIGTSLDINAVYYIGRIYANNSFDWTVNKKNYLDRIGLWYLEADGKILLQEEKRFLPAFSSGVKGSFTFRDSPQPNLTSPSASFKVTSKNTNQLFSIYAVVSKHISQKIISSIGYAEGDIGKTVFMLSEFLSDRSSELTYNHPIKISHSTLFFNSFYILKEKHLIGFEVIIPQGSTFSPRLVNLQLANILKLNFQLSYLTYKGGKELLGMFNFRYSFYPR